ncbi:MAG: TraB/GumN family protein [Archaeoglobus sp.]|nr:TraB/GumN family protein [Archaeoglobus sp.]
MEKKLIIVGTAHVSRKSVEEVLETIDKEKPDAVAVELCPRRFNALFGKREELDVREVLKKGDFFLILLQLLIGYFQRKIGEEMKVKPGEEMIAAIKKAREIGADVLLIDRDIAITFKRLWTNMSFFEKLKFFYHIFRGFFVKAEVDEMLMGDVIDALVEEFRKISPKAAKVLIDERDAFMAFNLRKALERYNKVVAVVGAGHKKGIVEWLQREIKPEDLLEIKERKTFKYISIIFSAFLICLFTMIATFAFESLYQVFIYWFFINGFFAALGAVLARGHPFSVIAAFSCAWFTSLNPFLAAGWFSGFVEAWVRRPSMDDVEKLFSAKSFGELLQNKFFRVILVAAMTNLGSTIGTLYGSYYIATNFGIEITKHIQSILRF